MLSPHSHSNLTLTLSVPLFQCFMHYFDLVFAEKIYNEHVSSILLQFGSDAFGASFLPCILHNIDLVFAENCL